MMRWGVKILLCFFIMAAAPAAYAGSPTYVSSNSFYKWKDGRVRVWIDPGPFSENTSNEIAREMLQEAWQVWEDAALHVLQDVEETVRVSGVQFIDMGDIPGGVDIDHTNYQNYFFGDPDEETGAYDPTRPTVIIFDKDGEIMKDLVVRGDLPSGADDSILGLTDLYAKDATTKHFINGTIILNGKYWDSTTDKDGFEVALIHELGHLINLDHSAINDDCYGDENCAGDMDGWQYLPTMFRYPLSVAQKSLHRDDATWAALVYSAENSNIRNEFCMVKGTIYDRDGRGFQGAQVVAFETGGPDKPQSMSVAAISGAFYGPCAEDGTYYLAGLRPGKIYRIRYGPIPDWCGNSSPCTLVSGINPYAPPRPLKETGDIFHEGGYEFSCENGGETIEATYVKLKAADLEDDEFKIADNLDPFVCEPGKGAIIPEPEEPAETSPYGLPISKKGWCSLVAGSPLGFGFLLFLLPLVTLILIRRRNSSSL